jgi:quinol monooxygenase YgiN
MPVRLIVTFPVQPGKGKDFAQAFAQRLVEVREEPGCEQYELFVSTERPDGVVLLEQWSSPETLQAHLELNQQRGAIGRDFLSDRPKLERFET